MVRGGAHFTEVELDEVLGHYNIGEIVHVNSLSAGNKCAPKMVIISKHGKYLLKRRPKGKDDLYHVAFAHSVQEKLDKKGFPVTKLVETLDEDNTILQLENHIYELFEFAAGVRYDGSSEATRDAGKQLARFHRSLSDFDSQLKPLRGSFHDSTSVRHQLKLVSNSSVGSDKAKLFNIADVLASLYNNSSVRVNQLGFDSWDEQVVHGDWHPGNMLFSEGKINAVLDFDSVKLAATVTDLANGMLQFSIIGDRPNPAEWPEHLDEEKLIDFLGGYREVIGLGDDKVSSLLDLMIETMIAEAVLPIAATGFFRNLSGAEFLAMIRRKAKYIDKNRDRLSEAIQSD